MKATTLIMFSVFPVAASMAACSSGDTSNEPGAPPSSSSGSSGSATSSSSSSSSSGAGSSSSSSSGANGSSSSSSSSSSSGGGGDDAGQGDDGGGSSSSGSSSGSSSSGGSSGGAAPYGDPNLVSIFDGTTLNGWIDTQNMAWTVMGGAIHGLGPGRGVLYTKGDYGAFRLIFSVRHLPSTGNDHQPCILFWGTRMPPIPDAIGGIQFQVPNGGTWDYRPGQNKGNPANAQGMPEFTHPAGAPKFDNTMWTQCEVLALTGGTAKLACCQPAGGPSMACKSKEVVDFNNSAAFRSGPLGLQVHNAGLHDEYKDIYIETNPTQMTLITM